MIQKTKPSRPPGPLPPEQEGPLLTHIDVGYVKNFTLLQLEIPGSDVIVVKCDMCQREIWTEYYEEGIKFVCGACCEELPR